MSMNTPPRGRGPQRPTYQPPELREQKTSAAPKEPRKRFPFVIAVAAIALVAIFIKVSASDTVAATYPGATANFGKTAKPGKSSPAPTGQPVPVKDLPVITEVMTSNSGSITAADGKYYDWIELYNPTGHTINLQGFTLSDNLKKPTKYVLPSYALAPGEFAIVYCDGNDSTPNELHAKFKLKASGQMLVMVDTNGAATTIALPPLQTNTSYALDMGDMKTWTVTSDYTPGFPNTKEGRAAYLETRRAVSPAIINEVMAGNTLTFKDADGDYSDWVEIYNGSDIEMDLTGWGLSNRESEPKRWELPAVKLGPKQYLVVFLSGKNRTDPANELHTGFRLNAFKDTILLSNLRGQIVSEVAISNLKADASFGMDPASDQWKVFTHPTPGQPNTEDGFNALQSKLYGNSSGDIVISEVMTNNVSELKDQDGEYPDWIELYNRGSGSVSLNGWGLTNKSDELGRWKFPDITLKAGQYYTVFASGKNIVDPKKKLHTDFNIGSAGDIIVLTKPDDSVADRCLVPQLRNGVSYGKPAGGSQFEYLDNPTPGAANPHGYPGFAPDPVFSLKAGQYNKAQKLTVSTGEGKASVRYTLDCTTPKQVSSAYAGPIDVQKTTVIRAASYRDGYLPSNVVSSTYLIGEDIGLPIVSVVTDPANLDDPNTGIYVKGPHASSVSPYKGANFWQDWEKPAHVELMEPDGAVAVSQDMGIKIFGAYSRKEDYKGFSLIARSKYGKSSVDYQLFPDLPFTQYKSFVLRPGAQDVFRARIRDVVITSLVKETTDLPVQAYRSAILFVNGEFWGETYIREKINAQFIGQHYNVDPTKIDLLEGNGNIIKTGSNKDYKELITYVKEHDLSNQANYDYVASKVDVDNYIDYITTEICSGNTDLGNIRFWKEQAPGAKWRWIYYDFCWGFSVKDRSDISLDLNPAGNGANKAFSTVLVNGLLKNQAFKQKFLKRLAYHISVTFEKDHVLQRINDAAAEIEPYMDRDRKKWGYGSVTSWQKQVDTVRDYARTHPDSLKRQMKDYFNLSDADMAQLFNN